MIHSGTKRSSGSQQGFSLIELLIVVTIISILAALAQPQLHRVLLKARAADVVAEMNAVRIATLTYQGIQNAWPPEAGVGVIPAGLAEFLPDGFDFNSEEYALDFDFHGGVPFMAGITMVTSNSDLGLAVIGLLGKGVTNTGNKYSWIID